ncbi:MAG: CDGSH iron-sulfur domain-containing protein, partial [Burkholderiales bacterium]
TRSTSISRRGESVDRTTAAMSAQASVDAAAIEVVRNGPYRVSGACRVRNARGEDVPVRGRFALCRCGSSGNKPFCDGTHAQIGFDGTRFTEVSPGAAQSYRGRAIAIHDNRALCAHSSICTDNLPGVFRLGGEPWIDADGADAAAAIAIVERCPSGALSYSLDGAPPPAGPAEPLITASANGPYFVSGRVDLRAGGARPRDPRRYALCRCGGSKNKPFCDGTHWAIRFDEGRGRQAGMFAPPLGVRRLSIVVGGLLVAGVAAAIFAIEAAGKWSAPGFLGRGGLIADLNLALELLLVAGLTFGYWLAKRGNIAAHRYNQTVWVLVNTVLVALIMARGMENAAFAAASDLAKPHILVPWLHAAVGAATVAAGLWLVLQMNGILPKPLHVRGWKTLMRATLAGYWAVALLGFSIYYLWFMR